MGRRRSPGPGEEPCLGTGTTVTEAEQSDTASVSARGRVLPTFFRPQARVLDINRYRTGHELSSPNLNKFAMITLAAHSDPQLSPATGRLAKSRFGAYPSCG